MTGKTDKKSEPSATGKSYLIGYNFFQAIGWGYTLILALTFIVKQQSLIGTWNHVNLPLKFFQTFQAMEVFHILIGLVKSPVITNIIQISSRLLVLWGILFPFPEIANSIPFILLLVAWCIAEITRYLFYASALLKSTPYLLMWCRYSFFMVLYPVGVTGELLCMLASIPYIKKTQLLTLSLPNAANISFYFPYVIYGIGALYIPGFPMLFSYMLSQRKKFLGSQKEKTK